jgi:hypothetical protein
MAKKNDKKETSDAQKKAMKKYDNKFDTMTIRFPKGTIELLHEHGVESINAYVNKLIEAQMLKKKDTPEGDEKQ